MKLKKEGLENAISKLKQLSNSEVKFGIFGNKARRIDNDKWTTSKSGGRISIGHLARIIEEGRTYTHKGGVVRFKNHAGEERVWRIKPGTVIHIPSRPFFTYAFTNIKKDILGVAKIQIKLLMSNNSNVKNMLTQIGKYCSETVKKEISEFKGSVFNQLKDNSNLKNSDKDGRPLKAADQIWKKGHKQPLTDSGKLLEAVDYSIKYKKIK